ncbi:hypothetical protein OG930_33840 [Streptomyces sp. NBC_01799]|nr:hypothetical protein OG930_33840 [Streptomyces sp. NBC_01799]
MPDATPVLPDLRLAGLPRRRTRWRRAFTDYVMDLGLIAVSADEVGVFWPFNAN